VNNLIEYVQILEDLKEPSKLRVFGILKKLREEIKKNLRLKKRDQIIFQLRSIEAKGLRSINLVF
jgi:hypothetical protein